MKSRMPATISLTSLSAGPKPGVRGRRSGSWATDHMFRVLPALAVAYIRYKHGWK